MNDREPKNRSQIDTSSKWDIEAMYPDEAQWEKDLTEVLAMSGDFLEFRGHLTETKDSLLRALKLYASLMQKAEHALVYAHMRHDEDNADAAYTEMNSKALSMIASVSASCSWFTPELLTGDESLIRSYLEEEDMAVYRHMIESILDEKAHVLSPEEEKLLAQVSEVMNGPDEIYSVLADAEMDFGTIDLPEGRTTLTHGNYIHFMESEDRDVRRRAFEQMHGAYGHLNHTIATMYAYSVKQDCISAKIRRYKDSLDAALAPEHIPESVYHNLIDAVRQALPAMHRYVGLRKRALGVEHLHMYDVYRPLIHSVNFKVTFEEAVDICCRALAPLGEEYVQAFRRGVLEERWVDIYENKGKTSGAYSFGSYDSKPYILMNFKGTLHDVFTLIHEGGHSMHSYYTRKTQPYIYGSHSIFTAEVASTVNETLLIHYLLENTDDLDMRRYLINFYIDEFKSTLYRQTMFAEFELHAHRTVEQGGSLTAEMLNEYYAGLNADYFGPDMDKDDYICYEWSRIPHFYRAYYVYQYATGFSAANAIANRILNGGESERDDYLRFLTTGDSDDPIELLKIAGVDMSTEEPIQSALSTFGELVDELDHLL